jgi:hypothetical protein
MCIRDRSWDVGAQASLQKRVFAGTSLKMDAATARKTYTGETPSDPITRELAKAALITHYASTHQSGYTDYSTPNPKVDWVGLKHDALARAQRSYAPSNDALPMYDTSGMHPVLQHFAKMKALGYSPDKWENGIDTKDYGLDKRSVAILKDRADQMELRPLSTDSEGKQKSIIMSDPLTGEDREISHYPVDPKRTLGLATMSSNDYAAPARAAVRGVKLDEKTRNKQGVFHESDDAITGIHSVLESLPEWQEAKRNNTPFQFDRAITIHPNK